MTYTIAGHDPVTGQVGLATASYSANLLGNVAAVHRGTAGTALVAAQAFSDPRVGRRAARLLAEGAGRDAVLMAVQDDPGAAFRQLVGVTSGGLVLACSGELCVPVVADRSDDGAGVAVAGNMLADGRVVAAAADAFSRSGRDGAGLADRLLTALRAGHRAGGDLRGDRAAGLLVLGGGRGGEEVDLRVDLDADPVAALERVRAATRDRVVARACRAWAMAPRPDRGRGRALLATLDALAAPDVEAQAWTAVLRAVLDGAPEADLPPAVAALAAGFTAMTARWSAEDEDGE